MTARTKRAIPWRQPEQPTPSSSSSDYMTSWRAFKRELDSIIGAGDLPASYSWYRDPLGAALQQSFTRDDGSQGESSLVTIRIKDNEFGHIKYEVTRRYYPELDFYRLPMAIAFFRQEIAKALRT
jgi:hypothetical protein